MSSIAFVDTEIEPNSQRILDIASLRGDGSSFHKISIVDFIQFVRGTEFICGHNILNHDVKYIGKALSDAGVNPQNIIDTLFLSPLLFPTRPYHALLKDDKLQTEDANNPLNDCIKAKDLFFDEVSAFTNTEENLKQIFYLLLKDKIEFSAFFRYIAYNSIRTDIQTLIREKFKREICDHVDLAKIIIEYPIELAYCLSLVRSLIQHKKIHSITPPWVLKNYPEVERIMFLLRNKPCIGGCVYCDNALNIYIGLKKFFGFDSFRTFGGEPLQEKAVKAAIDNKSILAVFPTGGGKSITFQVPALMSGETVKGLTVVISPLQSLMKDQVDNLEKIGLTDAVTINGLLDPIERAKSFGRVEDGSATILYISPESLRSRTIERLILGRKVARFVIDEAHCFSAWGQDFRVDYMYIGDFIRQLQEKKNLDDKIPVSCFTATAKQKVIQDIREYFKDKLSLDLELYTSKTARSNLRFKVFKKTDEEDKYQALRDLIEENNCPTIVYVSRTKKACKLAERLTQDGFIARPYHGKMNNQEKTDNQDSFISGECQIIVATSAFGMGIDKKDVGMVVHYEISDSLENYVQEAGRAGRDENISADCFVLFNEEDLNKHFILLNQTKLSIKEIQQIWKAIKDITRFRLKVGNSALEIARMAGWDGEVAEIETRVITAIAALEDAGYLKRGQNMPKIFANSILSRNAQEAIGKINGSERFDEKQKVKGIRIIKKLFSSKSRKQSNDEAAESRIDYICDHLGIVKEEVINIVNLLREENILADAKDLTAFIKRGEHINRSLTIVQAFSRIEKFLLSVLEEREKIFHIKELNESALANGCDDVTTNKLKIIINFLAIKNWIKRQNVEYSKNHLIILSLHPREMLENKAVKRHILAGFIVKYLYTKSDLNVLEDDKFMEEVLVEFSVHELKVEFERRQDLYYKEVSMEEIEDALFYLSRIDAIKIEGGFMVVYNKLSVERIEQDLKKRYKVDDYQKLNQFYENKVQQIHIVGEYANKMLNDYKDALQFVDDYFQLNYQSFLAKYFKGNRRNEINRSLTPNKFRQLFGDLSPTQLKIISDNKSQYITVLAGPGSGKTRVLVHKLASLLLMEDVKHEQLLMLTFSRAAATEFKRRLMKLIGNAAHYIEIKTFHSYCFDLLGKVGTLNNSDRVLRDTIEKIKSKEIERSRFTKTVLVIDEAQDMDEEEFNFIRTLIEENEGIRVLAVGDDDQNIYEFRGASSKYLQKFLSLKDASKYELIENYRSNNNLVDFTNQFVNRIQNRLKCTPIISKQMENGKVKIVRYHSGNLITPLVCDMLLTGFSGTTCVLTKTNEEALQMKGLLLKQGMPAKLIQTNDGFSLFNLVEVRYFWNQVNVSDIFIISDDLWAEAKVELLSQFKSSSKLDICLNIIRDFEDTNPKVKYKSDLEVFIRESKIEDFNNIYRETIFVSTMHKAKGKEFDNVFILLDNFGVATDESKRLLYVAMTRAKQNLTIHCNTNIFDDVSTENVERVDDGNIYLPPEELLMSLIHENVKLGYFNFVQHRISKLIPGDILLVTDEGCADLNGDLVLKFAKKTVETIAERKRYGYTLKSAKVNFLLYWWDDRNTCETKIVLPDLIFKKV